MLEKKKIASLRARIVKDKNSFSCMGGMLLSIEFQTMTDDELSTLWDALRDSKNPIQYDSLDNERLRRMKAVLATVEF